MRELHDEYARWYIDLLHRFESKRPEIIALADEALHRHAHDFYGLLLATIKQQILGGAVVYARAV